MKYAIIDTYRASVSTGAPITVAAKTRHWCARVVSDVAVYVKVDGVAANTDFYIPAAEPTLLAIPKDATISILGAASGFVNVCNVQLSA